MRDREIDIVALLESEGIPLRRQGAQLFGRCPFHADKTPSLAVNVEKQKWYCHGCHIGGDAIAFIKRFHDTDFLGALKRLGVDHIESKPRKPKKRVDPRPKKWAREHFLKAQRKCRAISQKLGVIEFFPSEDWGDRRDILDREFEIMSSLSDDLADPDTGTGFYKDPEIRAWVEKLVGDAPDEPAFEFPPVTEEYKTRLKEFLE